MIDDGGDDDDDVMIMMMMMMTRVLHKHLPNCPGQVKVRFGQAFWKAKKWQLPKSGKLKVYCGHTTVNKKITLFWGGK